MATYVNDLRLKEIATGDESGTWGTSTNTNLELISESMGYGTEAIANASTHTITMADGATDGFRCTFLRLTGGGQACTVTLAPNTVSHTWIMRNATSYALTLTQGSGANVILAAGQAKIITTDGLGSGAVVYECLEDVELGGTLTVGIDDAGYDVKFFGATSGSYMLWDESADKLILYGQMDVGVNDTGYDVKFFGATSGKYWLWDESADGVVQYSSLTVGVDDTGYDVKLFGATSGKYWLWDESADGVLQYSSLTVGVDDTGYDVKFFGATSGAYMLWDESADDLVLAGAAGLDIAGDIDVDGTANLDVVDIDGATQADGTITVGADDTGYDVKFFGATASAYMLWDESADDLILAGAAGLSVAGASTLTGNTTVGGTLGVTGVVTANAGVVVDNITIDGTTIALSSGDLVLDSAGDIVLDSGGSEIFLKDDGTQYGTMFQSSSNFYIKSSVSDADMIFQGNDGGSGIDALTFDMSAAGAATFNSTINSGASNTVSIGGTPPDVNAVEVGPGYINLSRDDTADAKQLQFGKNGALHSFIETKAASLEIVSSISNADIIFKGNDDGSAGTTVLTLDMSAAGYATFLGGIRSSGGDIAAFGANTGSSANRFALSMEGSGVSRIISNGPDSSTNGTFEVFIANDGGTGAVAFRIAADNSLSTPTLGTSNVRFGVNAGNSIASGGNYNVCIGDEAGTAITTGDDNVAIGFQALDLNQTGSQNVAIGTDALGATTASWNTAVGREALKSDSTGGYNTAVGRTAGVLITEGAYNVVVGANALDTDTKGSKSTAVGYGSLATQNFTSATNSNNTAVGHNAGTSVTTGIDNTLIGAGAADQLSDGHSNTIVGATAGDSITTGDENVAIGHGALDGAVGTHGNTAVGTDTMGGAITGSYNTALGYNAMLVAAGVTGTTAIGNQCLDAASTGDNNTGVGAGALGANTDGHSNTAVGYSALTLNVSGDGNTAVGYATLDANTANSNTAVGYNSLTSNQDGDENTAVGINSLSTNVSGGGNVALGYQTLYTNTASHNTAVGYNALVLNGTGTLNAAVGAYALDANTTGSQNTALGKDALGANYTANNNTAVGYNALGTNYTGTTNVAVGASALATIATNSGSTAVGNSALNLGTAARNTALGTEAGDGITTGGDNICIGFDSGSYTTVLQTGGSNILIRNYCQTSIVAAAYQTVIGYNVAASGDQTFTFGNSTTDTTCDHGGTTWTAPSDIRLKEDIQDEVVGLAFINELRPVTFLWKKEKDVPEELVVHREGSEERVMNGKYNHGFVAQEVKEVIDNNPDIKEGFDMWRADDADGRQRIGEAALIPMLVKSIQELSAEVEDLKKKAHNKCDEE